RLSSFLHQAMNKNSQVCTKVNLDELWGFFFESGFVYPQKYFFIHSNREKFEEVYRKLYENDSDIAINFIYQDKGEIFGHMSMFRFYEKSWIINHHAANSARSSRAGLVVLEQIGRYINEFHRLPSTRMDYVACYFRPENRFPNLVFGGAAKRSSDGCTMEDFAYMHVNKKSLNDQLPAESWSLEKAAENDIRDLTAYYDQKYGGLTLKALDIDKFRPDLDTRLNEEFKSVGFKRDRVLYALKYQGDLVAVFMVNVTELGMNMSDLTNGIHVFVVDEDRLPSQELHSCLARLSSYYEHNNLSILVYPKLYAENNAIPFDKTYSFWVLDVDKSSDEYFKHVHKLIKRAG
ncbi:PilZ domain-containing protein, partial [Thermodesulfobacteriota bacterium]